MVCSTQALKWQSLLLSQRPSTIAASSKVPEIVLTCFWHQQGCHHCSHSWLTVLLFEPDYFGSHFWLQKNWIKKLTWDWMADLHISAKQKGLPWLPGKNLTQCELLTAKRSSGFPPKKKEIWEQQKATVASASVLLISCGNLRFHMRNPSKTSKSDSPLMRF